MSRSRRFLPPTSAFDCIPVPLDTLYVLGVAGLTCPICHAKLILHQLDPALRDRLLAACGDCKAWCLVDRQGGLMLLLPDGT